MRIDDETLMAHGDGALSGEEAARIAAAVASDPALAERLAQIRAGGEAARGAFAEVLAEPVPPRLLAAIAGPAPAPPLRLVAGGGATPVRAAPPRRRWGQGMAVAASLLLGLVGGWALRGTGEEEAGWRLGPALVAALETAPSGGGRPDGVRVLASHPMAGGGICRVFAAPGGQGGDLQGLACRAPQGGWDLRALVARAAPAAGGYAPASAEDPLIAEMLERLGAGAALTEAEERAAIGRGWPAR